MTELLLFPELERPMPRPDYAQHPIGRCRIAARSPRPPLLRDQLARALEAEEGTPCS
jgi:hypothetical protein